MYFGIHKQAQKYNFVMKNIGRIMEYLWLIVAGLCLATFGHAIIHYGWHRARIFLLFFLLSMIMYFWRRAVDRRREQEDEN